MKPTTAVNTHGGTIELPALEHGEELDYEVELAIVIGKPCKDVTTETALDYVAGYTVSNDVSGRCVLCARHSLCCGSAVELTLLWHAFCCGTAARTLLWRSLCSGTHYAVISLWQSAWHSLYCLPSVRTYVCSAPPLYADMDVHILWQRAAFDLMYISSNFISKILAKRCWWRAVDQGQIF